MVIKPVLQALLLADHVYHDSVTGKFIIAGTFNRLWANEFPSRFGRTTFAYLRFTNIPSPLDVYLRYVDLKSNEVLLETRRISLGAKERNDVIEAAIEVPPFPLPHEGFFAFEVHVEDEMLGSIRMQVARRIDK